MYSRILPVFLTALIALLAGCSAVSPSSPAPGAAAAPSPAAAAVLEGPETGLKKGMTAAAVRQIMGVPAEIKPMQAPSGKAETWIYRRTIRGQDEQVQIGSRSTDIASLQGSGAAGMPRTIEEPILRQQTPITEVTVNLLMFDDTLVEWNRVVRNLMEYH